MARFARHRRNGPVHISFSRNVTKDALNNVLNTLEELFEMRVTFDASIEGGIEFHVARGYKAIRFPPPVPPPVRCRYANCNMGELQHRMLQDSILIQMQIRTTARCNSHHVKTKLGDDVLFLRDESMTLWNFKSVSSTAWTTSELDKICMAFKDIASVKRDKRIKRFGWSQEEIEVHDHFAMRSMQLERFEYDLHLQQTNRYRSRNDDGTYTVWGRQTRSHYRNEAVLKLVYILQPHIATPTKQHSS